MAWKKKYSSYSRPRAPHLVRAAVNVLVDTDLMSREDADAIIAKAIAMEL